MTISITLKVNGELFAAELDGEQLETLLHMTQKKHRSVERKWLDREDRYVLVGDARQPPRRLIEEIKLTDEESMSVQEFQDRQNGTFKKQGNPIQELLSKLASAQQDESEDKPTLN